MSIRLPITRILVLALFVCVFLPCSSTPDSETVVIYKDNHTNLQYTGDKDTKRSIIPDIFTSPAFVVGDFNNKEFFAVFASVRVSNYREYYTEGVVRTSHGNYTQWTSAQIFTNVSKMNTTHRLWEDVAAVMKGNTIYVLATSVDTSKPQVKDGFGGIVRDPLMIIGTILNRTASSGSGDDVFIKWGPAKSIISTLPSIVHGTNGSKFIGGEGNGIVTTNGTIIFPIRMVIGDEERIASVLYSNDDGSTWNIGGATEKNTTTGSLVEWSDGKLLFTVASKNGYRKVFESNDMGATWQQSSVFFGVWGNNINRYEYESQGSVIKVPVDNKDVLLFSHSLNQKGVSSLNNLQLWLSDGQRIMCVGTISDEEKERKTGHSILAYVNKHLYITHQINPFVSFGQDIAGLKDEWKNVIGLTPLPEFFENIMTTVGDWRDIDEFFENKGIPTKWLVGVLENTTGGESVWTDMYNCVDATVTGGEPVDGGFRFDGKPGSGAKWPVASQGQNQVYMFTKKEFTLTATVTMHATSGDGEVLILGASAYDYGNDVLIGVGYTKEKKWFALQNKSKKTNTQVTVEPDNKYQVALTFANETGTVYLDGVEIASEKITLSGRDPISHFFIGGIEMNSGEKGDPCTVKNVMLFSRALNKDEIGKVTKMKESNETYKKIIKVKPVTVTESSEGNLKIKVSSAPEILKAIQTNISKNTVGDESAAVSLSAVGWVCVACSVFVLMGL